MTNQSINSTLHYSDIDEPLYFYNNSTLFESYKLKNVLSTNRLANISSDGKWEWNKNLDKTLFERRGNFFGKTLNAMTGHEPYMTFLPNAKELQQSEIIPDSFEVPTYKIKNKIVSRCLKLQTLTVTYQMFRPSSTFSA